MSAERWSVRDAASGKLLSIVVTADIDYALALGRKRHYHHVTVDNRALNPFRAKDQL